MIVDFVPLRPEHAAISPHLRQQDIDEIHAACDWPVEAAVAFSIAHSEKGFTALLDGIPCAVFGVNNGIIWLVATDEITTHPVAFFRHSRRIFNNLKEGYSLLENYVHVSNTLSIRWLRWLGFSIEPPRNGFHHVFYTNKEE